MSFFDEEIDAAFEKVKAEQDAKFTKRSEDDKILEGTEIDRIKGLAFEYLSAQLKKPIEDRDVFYSDEFGWQTTFFKVDDEDLGDPAWNIPEYNNPKDQNEATLSVLFPPTEARLSIKLDKKFFILITSLVPSILFLSTYILHYAPLSLSL